MIKALQLFMDDDFINRIFINTIVLTDTFVLALGIDDKIEAKKILIDKFTESKGLFGETDKLLMNMKFRLPTTASLKKMLSYTINCQSPLMKILI